MGVFQSACMIIESRSTTVVSWLNRRVFCDSNLKASQMLANAGAEMNFVLDALQDFHYSELSLTINKSAAHDLTVTLSLLGQNPGIKEGK